MDLFAAQKRHAELFHLETARHVAECGRLGIICARGQAETHHGKHHVAGSRDVVDLPRPRWQQFGPAIARRATWWVQAASEHGLHAQVVDQPLPRPNSVFRTLVIVMPVAS